MDDLQAKKFGNVTQLFFRERLIGILVRIGPETIAPFFVRPIQKLMDGFLILANQFFLAPNGKFNCRVSRRMSLLVVYDPKLKLE